MLQQHVSLVMTLARESIFIFRAQMAESLGNILIQPDPEDDEVKPDSERYHLFALTYEEFQDTYQPELMDLVNDSDNMVRLKAFESCYKLIAEDYIEPQVVTEEIFPAFIRLLGVIMEDEDGVNELSGIIAMFIH